MPKVRVRVYARRGEGWVLVLPFHRKRPDACTCLAINRSLEKDGSWWGAGWGGALSARLLCCR